MAAHLGYGAGSLSWIKDPAITAPLCSITSEIERRHAPFSILDHQRLQVNMFDQPQPKGNTASVPHGFAPREDAAITVHGQATPSTRGLTGLIGKHLIYTYDNGWQYEIYVKNANTFSYRIHSGIVGGRWVTDQEAHLANVGDNIYKIAWDEPTGTTVSIVVNLTRRRIYGTIFFPRWIADDPTKTVCYQNRHLARMRGYRDQGPTYPKLVIDETATITFVEDCGAERSDVIDRPPAELPVGYTSRTS